MLNLILVRNKNEEKYILSVETKNVETHSLMTDYPEVWQRIQDIIRTELTTIVRLDELAGNRS